MSLRSSLRIFLRGAWGYIGSESAQALAQPADGNAQVVYRFRVAADGRLAHLKRQSAHQGGGVGPYMFR